MSKLKLDLNELRIESFQTARPNRELGTVKAHQQASQIVDSDVTACTCASGEFTMGCNMESFTRCDWTFGKC